MAREWDRAARGGLNTLIDAYQAGQDRTRGIAKEKADSQREGSQWAFTNTKNYRTPVVDEYGFVKGYETNRDTRRRNTPILDKLKPEYFRDPPSVKPPVPAPSVSTPSPEQDFTQNPGGEKTPSGRPQGKNQEDYAREAAGESLDPKPLLRDHKAAQAEAQLQSNERQNAAGLAAKDKQAVEANEVKRSQMQLKPALPGESARTAVLPEGADPSRTIVDENSVRMDPKTGVRTGTYSQTGITRPDDLNIVGSPPPPNPAPNPQLQGGEAILESSDPAEYEPDDYMMGRITDLATTPTPRASDQMISVSSLPPALLAGTGLEGFKGQVPASFLKEALSGKIKLDLEKLKGENKANAVEKLESGILGPLADDLRNGKSSLGMALEDFEVMAGRPANKREEGVLSKVSAMREAELRAKMAVQNKSQTPPPGYRFREDNTLEEIPGGPAASKTKAAEEKKKKSQALAERTSSIVSEDIARALDLIENTRRGLGPLAPAKALIPGTDSYNLNSLLETVKANTTFDKLQAMREASPTGGALGQVSDREAELLQAAAGRLSVGMKKEDLIYNLKRINKLYGDIVDGPGAGKEPGAAVDLEAQAQSAIHSVESSGANASEKRTAIGKIRDEYKKRTGKALSLKKQGDSGGK